MSNEDKKMTMINLLPIQMSFIPCTRWAWTILPFPAPLRGSRLSGQAIRLRSWWFSRHCWIKHWATLSDLRAGLALSRRLDERPLDERFCKSVKNNCPFQKAML